MFLCVTIFSMAQYQVGHTTITFNDPDRTGGFGSGGGPGRQIQTEIYYPAASSGTDVPMIAEEFPVVVFGHGFQMVWSAYENIWEEMVPKGYIFAFPRTEGDLSPSHQDFGLDLSVVLDRMLAENDLSSSIFYEGINGRAGVMGHSMGGGASFLASAVNENAVTVVGLAPAETNPEASEAAEDITIPALVLAGDQDGVTPPAEHQIPIYNGLSSECKYFVSLIGGGHCNFANSNFQCSLGEGFTGGGGSLGRPAQHQLTYDIITPWLDYYLKGICQAKDDFIDLAENDTRVNSTIDCVYEPLQTPTISENGGVLTSSEANSYQWFKDGVELVGEINQTTTATEEGTYTVVVSDGICFEESEPFVLGDGDGDEDCDEPTNLITTTNQESVTVSWDGGNADEWEIVWVVEGEDPLDATNHLGSETVNDSEYTITNLSNGLYDVYVQAICDDENSEWVSETFEINTNDEDEDCDEPTNVTTTANQSNVVVSWVGGNASQWEVLWVTQGADPLNPANHLGFETVNNEEYTITDLSNGNYDVYVRAICDDENSEWLSSNVLVDESDVSINETSGVEFSIYPNPTNDVVNISLEKNSVDVKSIEVLNAQGQRVSVLEVNASDVQIDFSSFEKGMYFIVLQTTNNDLITSKVVKK